MAGDSGGRTRIFLWLGALAGLVLLVIGIRFLLVPGSAVRTFGLTAGVKGAELHYIIGLRDIWLALLAIAFAALREWRALALWLLVGAGVCFADGLIVLGAGGHKLAIAFHTGSGIFCLLLGLASWRIWRRAP